MYYIISCRNMIIKDIAFIFLVSVRYLCVWLSQVHFRRQINQIINTVQFFSQFSITLFFSLFFAIRLSVCHWLWGLNITLVLTASLLDQSAEWLRTPIKMCGVNAIETIPKKKGKQDSLQPSTMSKTFNKY